MDKSSVLCTEWVCRGRKTTDTLITNVLYVLKSNSYSIYLTRSLSLTLALALALALALLVLAYVLMQWPFILFGFFFLTFSCLCSGGKLSDQTPRCGDDDSWYS